MDLQGVPTSDQWDTMVGVAHRLEAAGFESAWVYDHFHTVPHPTQEPTYEAWTLMAALAATTDTIRLGQMCTCNSYRPPAYLAKVASTVDVVSGGRLEFAIGAGWYEHEYLAYGYDFPKPSVRIGQLGEAVQIIKRMWTEDEAHFEGTHYSVRGAINRPRPLQDPHPPLWIAGGGEKLTLRLVAEHADYANFAGTPEVFAHKSRVLEEHCEAVGRDYAEIGRTLHVIVMVDADDAALERAAAQFDAPVEKFLAGSQVVAGSADEVANRLGAYAEEGCEYFVVFFPDAVWGDGIEAFAAGVIPEMS
ncbi:MAG: LLM class F420-dependent oxidoreductase [Actinobacteria bacterium]|nr:LLM class F420-dependent oxidoreductase [Actinomycetota bacterium]